MTLITLANACLAYGNNALLDHVDINIDDNTRICLVGRNGTGKSTLLKVLSGDVSLDDGQRVVAKGIKIARLEQDPPLGAEGQVFDYVAEALADISKPLKRYFHVTQELAESSTEELLSELERLQAELDHKNAWQFEQRISRVLTQLGLQADAELKELSGGWLRKVALAKALVVDPDVLLLDEPTNHLDIDMIEWLNGFLQEYTGALIFISHDRRFIRSLATEILDLDRGQVSSYKGGYASYLDKKSEDLRVEEEQNREFDKKLAAEETWIRQGIKARRTRNEGRVRALKALRKERGERRSVQGAAKISVDDSQKSSKRVFELKNVDFAYDGKPIVKQLSCQVQRGDKIALVGPNGCGKTTLLKLFLKELEPDSGSVFKGDNLEIAYFDQYRNALDLEKTVQDNVADGKQDISIGGRTRHVLSYLQDFLFPPQRSRTPVKALSGGEKNRLLLAKLFVKPSNLLILDEPTNDLDIETLEILEDMLTRYQGTVLLVSHDREFVDNTAGSVLYFNGDGQIDDIVGGFTEVEHWLKEKQKKLESDKTFETNKVQKNRNKGAERKKLSYKLQLELDSLPEKLETLEQSIDQLQQQVSSPDFFKQPSETTNKILADLEFQELELQTAFERWEELESLK